MISDVKIVLASGPHLELEDAVPTVWWSTMNTIIETVEGSAEWLIADTVQGETVMFRPSDIMFVSWRDA